MYTILIVYKSNISNLTLNHLNHLCTVYNKNKKHCTMKTKLNLLKIFEDNRYR